MKDTYTAMEMKEFLQIVVDNNFIQGYKKEYKVKSRYMGGKSSGKEFLFYRKDGLILYATSSESHLYSAKLYGELRYRNKEEVKRLLPTDVRVHPNKTNQISFCYDATNKLSDFLNKITKCGEFICPWEDKDKKLDFTHHLEEVVDENKAEHICAVCSEVNKIIGLSTLNTREKKNKINPLSFFKPRN